MPEDVAPGVFAEGLHTMMSIYSMGCGKECHPERLRSKKAALRCEILPKLQAQRKLNQ